MPLILGTNSIKDTGFDVANSLRYNQNDDCLIKTFGSGGNRKKFTFSLWVKLSGRGTGNNNALLVAGTSGNDEGTIKFSNDVIDWVEYDSNTASVIGRLTTSQLFRDYSAWSHLVFVWDSGNATAGNRMRIYHNGSEITSFSDDTNPSLNYDAQINNNVLHNIGRQSWNNSGDYNGYMAEVCFIDGQALDPTSFGEFDEDTGIWKPIDVSGLTFGTNGFYLDFENSGSLGADVSGNGNNFTVNNLTSIDQTTDTPTNNFATWNPLMKPSSASTFSEGNLKVTNGTNSVYPYSVSNQGFSQGKWYAEFKYTPSGNAGQIGIMDLEIATTNFQANNVGSSSDGCITYQYNGNIIGDGTVHSTGHTSLSSGDIVGIAVDEDNQLIYFYVNGTLQNSGGTDYSGDAFTSGFVGFYCGDASGGGTDTWEANFGNPTFTISSGNSDGNSKGNFEYVVPSGYFALCTSNLAEHG